jgi:hypothetical protein
MFLGLQGNSSSLMDVIKKVQQGLLHIFEMCFLSHHITLKIQSHTKFIALNKMITII